ncbi:MAG: hypothetical protein U0841_35350 [Chloroflexia bacterium]
MQDAFRASPHRGGLLPIIKSDGDAHEIALVVPVDPFRGYLQDLARSLGHSSLQRPDILVFGISITPSRIVCRPPIEVKYRKVTLDGNGCREALAQARALSDLMTRLFAQGEGANLTLWKLAGQHFLLSMLDFGFRVYSQREELRSEPQTWAMIHQRMRRQSCPSPWSLRSIPRAGSSCSTPRLTARTLTSIKMRHVRHWSSPGRCFGRLC